MESNTAGNPDATANGSARREAGDRKWPWGVRLLVAVLLLPVWVAALLASENSFNGFMGIWFGPLMTAVIVAVVIAVWATTARSQRLRARVFASATRMAPRQLHRFHSGDLLDRVQADIDSLDRVVLAVAVPAVIAAIVGASGLAVLALIRPAFAVAVGLALAVAFAGDLVAGRRGRRAGGELARARAAAWARLVEVLDGRTEIAAYGAGPRALAELGERFGATDVPRRRWSAREGAGQLGTDLAAAAAVAVVLATGAGLGARPLSPAILAFAALLTMTMFEVAGSLAAAGPAAGQALAAWRRLAEMTGLGGRQAPADPAAPQPRVPASDAWARGDIALRGLIAGMGDEPVLSISALHLPGGDFIVLTGASGAGKSTLLRVLAGALRPMAGSVRIGGTDPHALRYEDLVAADVHGTGQPAAQRHRRG